MTHKSLFDAESEKFEYSADLNKSPPDRGFWTDEEMFEATGATSLRLIKALQRNGLLNASKYKHVSKWHRAWTISDLLVIQLADDFSAHSGFSIDETVNILTLIPRQLLEQALSIDPLIDQIVKIYAEEVDEYGNTSPHNDDKVYKISRIDDFTLILENRERLFVQLNGDAGKTYLIGEIRGSEWIGTDASLNQVDSALLARLQVAGSLLYLNLSRLGLSPINTQFRLRFEIDFVSPNKALLNPDKVAIEHPND